MPPVPLSNVLLVLALVGCTSDPPSANPFLGGGCPDAVYPEAEGSPYVMPFPAGTSVVTGLANCSSSFHSAGEPDALATDFDAPEGTPFFAARAGRVIALDDDEPSAGGGAGNYVLVDHGDGTAAYYLHSPADGIDVAVGDEVEAGDRLGVVGRSGLAGYPHLHFIVVEGSPAYPYDGVPVTFRNVRPRHVPLRSYTRYEVTPP